MRKRLLLFMALVAGFVIGASAQQQVFIVGGDTLPSNAHICLAHDGTSTVMVKFITVNLNNKDEEEFTYRWRTLGDLEIVDSNDADSSVTVRSTNLGKGAVRLYYNIGWCASYVDLYIYKEFNPADFGLEIEGPDCLTKGETVVYSVRPVLTRNLGAYIGVDNYYWNLNGENKPAFVDSIIYAAGDGSAVTFRVGDVSAGDEVVVNFGDCNREAAKSIRKPLGKTPPKPQVVENLCVPCGQGNTRVISVLNPIEGVDYKCKAPSQWEVVTKNISADAVSFTVKFDSISSDDLTITASFIDEEECVASVSNVHITRTWGEGAYMAYNNSAMGSCCAVVNGSTKYDFSVQGQIPTGALINWEIPAGWVEEDDNPYSRYRKIRPTAAAALIDTVMAWSETCDQTKADTVWMPVYVKPATVTDITMETCLSPNTAYTFRAVQSTDGPQAASYTWQVKEGNNYVTKSDFTGDSLVLTVTTDMQAVRVRPNGLEGCDGEFSEDKALVFKPAAPEGISVGCIAINMPDTSTFSIVNPVSNQQYGWVLPTGWSKVASYDNGQSIDVRTIGEVGTYTIGAYGIGTGVCGNSAQTAVSVNVTSSPNASIQITVIPGFGTMCMTTNLPSTATLYHWYIVHNGAIMTESGLLDTREEQNYAKINEPYSSQIGNPTNSTEYTVVVEYETTDGCKERITCGAPLNPSINYRSSTAAARIAPHRIAQEEEQSLSLILSPNPALSTLNAELQNGETFDIHILSVDGRVLYTNGGAQQYDIDVSSYPTGYYIVTASQRGGKKAMDILIKQ